MTACRMRRSSTGLGQQAETPVTRDQHHSLLPAHAGVIPGVLPDIGRFVLLPAHAAVIPRPRRGTRSAATAPRARRAKSFTSSSSVPPRCRYYDTNKSNVFRKLALRLSTIRCPLPLAASEGRPITPDSV